MCITALQMLCQGDMVHGVLRGQYDALQVHMVPYRVEDYKELVKDLKLWPYPRGHHQHLTRLPLPGDAQVLLADRRMCPWLPDHLRILPLPNLQTAIAERSMDCFSTCR